MLDGPFVSHLARVAQDDERRGRREERRREREHREDGYGVADQPAREAPLDAALDVPDRVVGEEPHEHRQ